jgi:hypothetical protein
LAFSTGFWFFLLFLAALYVIGEIIASRAPYRQKPGSVRYWDEWLLFYDSGEQAPPDVRFFARRIRSLYLSRKTDQILPFRLAARLLHTFHQQQNHLQRIESKLRQVENIYEPLKEGIERLDALRTPHELGRRSLSEIEAERTGLLQLQAQVALSAHKLEAILERAEQEEEKRALHAEVTRLSQAVSEISSEELPEVASQGIVSDFESQITSEITHYLRLEQEVERQLS